MKLTDRRVELPIGEPPLYLLFSEAATSSPWWGPGWLGLKDSPASTVHVMSPAAGGEVRGYWSVNGALWLRYPTNVVEWSVVDLAVAGTLGVDIFDRSRGGLDDDRWHTTTLATHAMAKAVAAVIDGDAAQLGLFDGGRR